MPMHRQTLAGRIGALATSNATQVRQPNYRSSIDQWRRYGHRLGPLLDALAVEPGNVAGGPMEAEGK